MARPSSYSEKRADEICERIARGESLNKLCELDGFPDQTTVYRWIEAHPEFRQNYARAREKQADFYAQEIVDIANEQAEVVDKNGHKYDPDVNRDRLRIDARKWFASKVAPKKYGDKLELAGNKEQPLALQLIERVVVKPE